MAITTKATPPTAAEKSFDPAALADTITNAIGSWRFIIVQTVMMAFWFLLNSVGFFWHWDPYPFVFLNLFMSMEAAYATPIILMSGNRQQSRDELKREMDSKTLQRIQQIEKTLDRHVNSTAQEHSKQLAEMRVIIGEMHAILCPDAHVSILADDGKSVTASISNGDTKSPNGGRPANQNGRLRAKR